MVAEPMRKGSGVIMRENFRDRMNRRASHNTEEAPGNGRSIPGQNLPLNMQRSATHSVWSCEAHRTPTEPQAPLISSYTLKEVIVICDPAQLKMDRTRKGMNPVASAWLPYKEGTGFPRNSSPIAHVLPFVDMQCT